MNDRQPNLRPFGIWVALIGVFGLLGNLLHIHFLKSFHGSETQEVDLLVAVAIIFMGLSVFRLPDTRQEDGPSWTDQLLLCIPGLIGLYYIAQYLLLVGSDFSELLTFDYPINVAFLTALELTMLSACMILLGRRPSRTRPVLIGLVAMLVVDLSIYAMIGHLLHVPVLFNFDQPYPDIVAFILVGVALLLATLPEDGLLAPFTSESRHIRLLACISLLVSTGILLEGVFVIQQFKYAIPGSQANVTYDLFEYSTVLLAIAAGVISLRAVYYFDRARRSEAQLRNLNEALEEKVRERTGELARKNQELESFASTVSHDLKNPIRIISEFVQSVGRTAEERLNDEERDLLQRASNKCGLMRQLVDDLLTFSRLDRAELQHETVDLSRMAERILGELQRQEPERRVSVQVEPGIRATGDSRLLEVAIGNLLSNAWKYTARRLEARIEFGRTEQDGQEVCFVRDNGAGFNMEAADRLFRPFERLHSAQEFKGTGIGLATVQRILSRHGGRVWGIGEVGQGATFYFDLPAAAPDTLVSASPEAVQSRR